MARTAKLPPNVAKLIKEIKNLEYSLDKRDRLGWAGVERSNLPDASMDRVVSKLEKLKKWEKNGIITGPQYKKAMSELKEIMPSLQRRVSQMGVVDGDMFRLPEPAPSAHVAKPNAYFDPKQDRRRPVTKGPVPGLIGTEVAEKVPDPMFPPKATRSVGAAPNTRPPLSPQTVGTYRDKLMNPRPRAPRSGTGRGPSIKLPSFSRPGAPALPPFTEVPRTSGGYGINPAAERATMNAPRDMIPDGRPMPTGAINMDATKEYDPKVKKMVSAGHAGTALTKLPSGEPTQFAIDEGRVGRSNRAAKARPEPENMGPWTKRGHHVMRLRKGLEDLDLAKAGKIGGKIAKGGLLGLPLLALDYMAPNNAIASSRREGYGMLDDMGLDIQGGIDSIENPWARGGASLLDGLLVDPAMTAVGGAKKFKEMIVRDAKAANKRRKDRKKNNWKPKLYRGGPQANGS